MKNRRSIAIVGTVVVALIGTGCTSNATSSSRTNSPPSGGADQPSASAAAGGNRLVVATNGAPGTLDVNTVDDTPAQALVSGNVLEGLTRIAYGPAKSITFVPVLATSWDKLSAAEWRFHIRKGVKFQNGQPLTADDVVYSINRRVRPKNESSALYAFLQKAVKVDDYTVDVYMTQPFPYIDRVVSGVMITPKGWGDDNPTQAATSAIGTGPYSLTSYTQGGNDAVLKRWDGYWGPKPKLAEIDVRVIPDAGAALSALKTGEVDVVTNVSPDLLKEAPATISVEGNRSELARLDARVKPFNDVRVREAVNLGTDRSAIIQNLRLGFATAANNQLVPSFVDGYNPDVKETPYDPAKAKQLIKEAGATGATVTISCASDQFDAAYHEICQSLAQNLDDIGLNAKLTFATHATWLLGLYAPSKKQPTPSVFVQQTGSYTFEAGATLATWLYCSSTRDTYCDPSLDSFIKTAASTPDPTQRTKLLQQAEAKVAAVYPFIMLDVPKTAVAVGKNVHGVLYPQEELTYWPEWSKS